MNENLPWVNKLHFMNGPSEQRLGNRAFMPPEILSARVGSTLDYRLFFRFATLTQSFCRQADRWSMSLIALDIMFGRLAYGNPFYPVKGGKRVYLYQEAYDNDDLAYYFGRKTPKELRQQCPEIINSLVATLQERVKLIKKCKMWSRFSFWKGRSARKTACTWDIEQNLLQTIQCS